MSLPDFYDPQRVGMLYIPQTPQAVDAGQAAGMSPAEKDDTRVCLLLVDEQIDFVHEDGALSVPGATPLPRRSVPEETSNVPS